MTHHAKKLIYCLETNGSEIAFRADAVVAIVQKGEHCTVFLASGAAFDLQDKYVEVCHLVREHG